MGTKNLARTLIEGGRSGNNKHERWDSNATARARVRAALGRIAVEPARADGEALPVRAHVRKDFHDRLGPAERWLRRQCGRPFDEVWAEMKARFDPRTTAGRHIVYGHMLGWIQRGAVASCWSPRFIVDGEGRLRPLAWRRPRRVRTWATTREERAAEAFARGRRVGQRGAVWFWFVAVPARTRDTPVRWRQDRRLSDAEVAAFEALAPQAVAAITLIPDS